jgi:hypothetical protein
MRLPMLPEDQIIERTAKTDAILSSSGGRCTLASEREQPGAGAGRHLCQEPVATAEPDLR